MIDRDRERAQARAGHKPRNPKDDGLTPEQRRERDAKALQEKAARKAAQAAGGGKENSGDFKNKQEEIVRDETIVRLRDVIDESDLAFCVCCGCVLMSFARFANSCSSENWSFSCICGFPILTVYLIFNAISF
ncbi:UNVERIFIED_CONTAM: hypothetical protein Sradi_0324500 [Sesamum radiatum]|uniref:Small EDRK-rich factor-like N-terminal domain-containing protein n=1 Tax=Sesamum radiatum TaxID=300843 RepID=A0AAW2W7I5_SESRA